MTTASSTSSLAVTGQPVRAIAELGTL